MLKGSIVALVTPFGKDGSLDEQQLEKLINWHIDNKTDGILACGTTGESATLTHTEHKQVVTMTVEKAAGRVPVVAGCGSNSTAEALELVRHAEKAGAGYALVITPYYNKPTQEGLYRHFKTVSQAVNIPIIIYNVPSRTGSNILPHTVARLYHDCENIVGIKEACGSLDQVTCLMSLVDEKFLLFSGADEINLPIMSVGGVGAISVVANVAPRQTHDLIASFLDGDIKKSRELQLYLYDLIKMLFIETNPIPAKTSLELMGIIDCNFRLPLCELSESSLSKLKDTLVRYKLI